MILAPLVVAIAAQPQLAFVARFYKPGTQKSRMEIYTSDLTGGNRKRYQTSSEPYFIHWLGKDRLVWVGDKSVWTSKLSPWKPVKVSSDDWGFQESRHRTFMPGSPIFWKEHDETKGNWILNATTLKLEQAMPDPNHGEIKLSEDTVTSVPNPSNPDHPLQLKMYEEMSYWNQGKDVELDLTPFRAFNTDGGDKLWVVAGTHFSSSGTVTAVLLFEKGKAPRTILDYANQYDFLIERPTFAYCTPRETSALGKKQVWTSELHVGDWRKGTNKTILKGLVWVPSVSIRP